MRRVLWFVTPLLLLATLSETSQPQALLPQSLASPQAGCTAPNKTTPHRSVPAPPPANIVQETGKVIVTCSSPGDTKPPAPDRIHDAMTLLASWPIVALIAGAIWSRSITRLLQVIADRLAKGDGFEIAGIKLIPPEDAIIGSFTDVVRS